MTSVIDYMTSNDEGADYQNKSRTTGFPSPAADYSESQLNFNDILIKNSSSTFVMENSIDRGDSWGIFKGDLLVVDRALDPHDGCLLIANIEGQFALCKIKNNVIYAISKDYAHKYPLKSEMEIDIDIWGIVTHAIHRFTK